MSYAIIKFTDLGGVFELFVFSDLFEQKREILKEGVSVFLNLVKNVSSEGNTFRINVKSLSKINEIMNIPINSIEIKSKDLNDLSKIKDLISIPGKTNVILKIDNKSNVQLYKLNQKRKIDQKVVNDLKNVGVTLKIN